MIDFVKCAQVGAYRSSPFFWAFSQCTKGVSTPVPIPGSKVQQGDPWSAAIYAITDAIPFYEVGEAIQTISGVCDDVLGCPVDESSQVDENGPDDGAQSEEEPSEGTSDDMLLRTAGDPRLVSEVTIQLSGLPGLEGMSSLMTTTTAVESPTQGSKSSTVPSAPRFPCMPQKKST